MFYIYFLIYSEICIIFILCTPWYVRRSSSISNHFFFVSNCKQYSCCGVRIMYAFSILPAIKVTSFAAKYGCASCDWTPLTASEECKEFFILEDF